jgi:predicted alpha-1,2-mannosidase
MLKTEKIKRYLFCLFISFSVIGYGSGIHGKDKTSNDKKITGYVNPFIGTAAANVRLKNLAMNFDGGNTYPGAVTPWGMTAISPRNCFDVINGGFSASPSGYIFGNEYFYGFGQIHLSGVGCPDWGNILVTPAIGTMTPEIEKIKSKYSDEKASPGYYKLVLNDFDIKAEVSATTRTTITKFTCAKATNEFNVVVDLYHAISASTDGYFKASSDSTIEGWSENGGFCGSGAKRKVFFAACFSKPFTDFSTYNDKELFHKVAVQNGGKTGGIMQFLMKQNESLLLKIGISFVSVENAKINLSTEQPGWDFEKVKSKASQDWENVLSRIKVEGASNDQKIMFYTALYHALIHPSICSDINGEYMTMGSNKVKKLSSDQKNQYSVFSLWDTYRNLHPLLSLVYPEVQLDLVRTMVDQSKEYGFLPQWELSGDETLVMVGDPACIVIADTYLKGLTNFDVQTAFNAMIKSSSVVNKYPGRRAGASYNKYGYIPQDNMGEWVWGSVATSLEYNLADYGIAQFAKALGKNSEYEIYLKRSMGYKNLFDPNTTFLRAKNENGTWCEPFNPDTIRGSIPGADFPCGGIGYTEGNAWQYNFFVPHDIPGMIDLMGKEQFVNKLQSCFENPERFVLFNEPDMAYPYLFDYAKGSEYLTQKMVRKSLENYFASNPGGLPGNDDCGTTSSWLVFSSMGFYPANPVSTSYQIGSPVFDKVTIKLNPEFFKGKTFVIETSNNSKQNCYIQDMKLNGKKYTKFSIDHKDIVGGGSWKVNMGDKPSKQ